MSRWKPVVALLAALATAIIWMLVGLSTGLLQLAVAMAVFVAVWAALSLLPGRRTASSGTIVREQGAEAVADPIPKEQRNLLAQVSSALADQQRAFDDTEAQLRDLRALEQQLLTGDDTDAMADVSRYRLATVRSQIEQLEMLLGTISTNIVALQTQRGAVQTVVAARSMPSPEMVMDIQRQLQQSQAALAIADEGTRSIYELTRDMAEDRDDLVGDLIADPVGKQMPVRKPSPVSPLAEPEG